MPINSLSQIAFMAAAAARRANIAHCCEKWEGATHIACLCGYDEAFSKYNETVAAVVTATAATAALRNYGMMLDSPIDYGMMLDDYSKTYNPPPDKRSLKDRLGTEIYDHVMDCFENLETSLGALAKDKRSLVREACISQGMTADNYFKLISKICESAAETVTDSIVDQIMGFKSQKTPVVLTSAVIAAPPAAALAPPPAALAPPPPAALAPPATTPASVADVVVV